MALGLVAAALFLSFPLRLFFPEAFVFLFSAAVMAAAWFGQAVSGFTAACLSMIAVAYFFVPPFHGLRIIRNELPYFVTFVLSAFVVSRLSTKRRKFEQKLRQKNLELEEKNIELGRALVAKDGFLASMSHE